MILCQVRRVFPFNTVFETLFTEKVQGFLTGKKRKQKWCVGTNVETAVGKGRM